MSLIAISVTTLTLGSAAGLGSTALVLSIAAPFGGSYWYALTALSPLAGIYYWQKGSRVEEFAVRLLTLATAGGCRQLLAAVVNCWRLSSIAGGCRQLVK